MEQKLMHVMAGADEVRLIEELADAGFRVTPSGRLSGGVHVLVRTGTKDEDAAAEIIERVAPAATLGPSGSPTTHLSGYRDGL
jgi:hypothetical protein